MICTCRAFATDINTVDPEGCNKISNATARGEKQGDSHVDIKPRRSQAFPNADSVRLTIFRLSFDP